MRKNWFFNVKKSQVLINNNEDPDIKMGPGVQKSRYYVGMKVRDRRKSIAGEQRLGKIEAIKGNKIKIIWMIKGKKQESIYDAVEDANVLSLIVEEV